jgi:hypothetical protein
MRRAYFLSAMLFTAVLCVSGIGLATAEPQKNQIVVQMPEEEDPCTNGKHYTFVINGMSKTGHVTPSTEVDVPNVRNIVVKQFTVKYYDLQTGKLVGSDEFDSGKKEGLQDDLIACTGVIKETVLQGLGPVRAVYDFQAFLTPRGKA